MDTYIYLKTAQKNGLFHKIFFNLKDQALFLKMYEFDTDTNCDKFLNNNNKMIPRYETCVAILAILTSTTTLIKEIFLNASSVMKASFCYALYLLPQSLDNCFSLCLKLPSFYELKISASSFYLRIICRSKQQPSFGQF